MRSLTSRLLFATCTVLLSALVLTCSGGEAASGELGGSTPSHGLAWRVLLSAGVLLVTAGLAIPRRPES